LLNSLFFIKAGFEEENYFISPHPTLPSKRGLLEHVLRGQSLFNLLALSCWRGLGEEVLKSA